jgi:hypothetical protein
MYLGEVLNSLFLILGWVWNNFLIYGVGFRGSTQPTIGAIALAESTIT